MPVSPSPLIYAVMTRPGGSHLDEEDGEAWARVYMSALTSPSVARKVTPSELAAYAHTVADRYIDFRRAMRRARHESRADERVRAPQWRSGREEPR
jgi:hypothetical protein